MTRYNITYLYRDNCLKGDQTLFREHILGRTIITIKPLLGKSS